MKLKAQNKLLCLLFALAIAVTGVICMSFSKVSANETTSITSSDFFTITNADETTSSEVTLDGTNMVLNMGNESVAQFKRQLNVLGLEVQFIVPDTLTELSVTANFDLINPNGQIVLKEGEFDSFVTEVDLTFSLVKESTGYVVKVLVNDEEVDSKNVTVTDGVVTINFANGTVNGETIAASLNSNYTPKMYCTNVVIGDFSFEVKGADSNEVKIAYIKQGATDEYKQTFVLEDGKIKDEAKTLVLANDAFYKSSTDSNGNVYKQQGEKLSISFVEYSILKSNRVSADFRIEGADVLVDDNELKTKTIWIQKLGEVSFDVKYKDEVYNTITVHAIADEKAPAYDKSFLNGQLYEDFKQALYEATFEEYEVNGKTEKHYIRLGSSNYLEIPSLEYLVTDETTAYADLTKTVYYKTENSDWTSAGSTMKIPLTEVGKYQFYVVFADKVKNSMEQDQFVNEDDPSTVIYSDFIFEFEVYNDAPISITAPTNPEKAYIGIEYTASSFTIEAKNYDVEYKLYYSKDNTTFDKEIIAISDLSESDDNYDEMSKYNYNGSLTFTPAESGYYKIVASIFEKESTKEASSEIVITATSAPKVVKPANNWAKNNVWSLVFLSIGTLSLIGIIVVLCVPEKKEEK